MVGTLADTSLPYATAKRWAAHCKMSKESLEDDDRCGRHTTATTEETIAHVQIITVMCISIGTPKSNKFSICSKWKIYYF